MLLRRPWKRSTIGKVAVGSGALILVWFAFGRTADIGYMRIESPDAKVDALVKFRDGGALRGRIYDVYIVKAGGSLPKHGERLFSAHHAEGVQVYWQENKKIQIDYDKARVAYVKPSRDCRGIVANSSELPYEVEVSHRPARIF